MPEPLLPELTTTATVTSFDSPGEWDVRSAKDLDDLRRGLKVTPARIHINSIPDIWARPLLFQMSLFDSSHPMHERTLGEWRGLLAILALKAVKNLNNLSLKPIHIAASANPDVNTAFLDAASKLMPDTALSPDTSWENSYIVLFHDGFHDRPIGMTSPTTLVYTSTHYFNHITGVQWFNTEHLEDPMSHLNVIERPALASWLSNLLLNLHSLKGNPGTNSNILDSLTGLVRSFHDDLAAAATTFVPAAPGFNISPDHGIFSFLGYPSAAAQAPPSPVRLIPSPGRTADPPILIVDKEIPGQWGVQPNQIQVGTKTLSDLTPAGHPDGVHTQFAGINIPDAEVWNAKEFFTERITLFRVPNAFPGTKGESWVNDQRPTDLSLILPIREKLLNYLDPEDLLGRLQFERTTDGGLRATLTLSLGDDQTSRPFIVTKEYLPADLEYLDEVPVIEVFPNFRVANWNSYFVAYSADGVGDSFKIRPLAKTGTPNSAVVPTDLTNSLQCVWQMNQYPEALVCQSGDNDIGVLFLDDPITPRAQPTTFTVGVDFGASGTTVYYSSGGTNATPLTIRNHKLTVTNLSDVQKAKTLDFFLPPENRDVPFLSLFKQFRNDPGLNDIEPMLEGHIHYYTFDSGSDLNRPDIYADLKWSDDPQSKLRVKALLTQICLQTTVELASQGASGIDWNFSFPTAFSIDKTNNFSTIWNQIVERCAELTGITFQPPGKLTESVAAANYFREKQAAATALSAVFIDIGSSTSDVSVWQKDKLLWQISLRLAGRDIFLNYLRNHPQIFGMFGINTDKLDRISANGDDAKLWAETDALLQNRSEEMFDALPLQSASPEIKQLRQHLALGLSGLFYYIGLGLKHLIDKDLFTEQLPGIYVGGNGSRMFRWLCDGNMQVDQTAASLFETIFRRALGTDPGGTFSLELSKLPKQEAAFGLVSSSILRDGVGYNTDVVAGENFVRDGQEFTWDTVISEDFFTTPVGPSHDLGRLADFVGTFNEFAAQNRGFAEPVAWDQTIVDRLRGNVATDLNNIVSRGLVDVEPVFIIAVRNLLAKM
ncbi:MAG: hypothetical protein IPL32_03690 [Chloracidobacterium sp.]|nr:hypothetical protein [Chloracidobacterium sp.]